MFRRRNTANQRSEKLVCTCCSQVGVGTLQHGAPLRTDCVWQACGLVYALVWMDMLQPNLTLRCPVLGCAGYRSKYRRHWVAVGRMTTEPRYFLHCCESLTLPGYRAPGTGNFCLAILRSRSWLRLWARRLGRGDISQTWLQGIVPGGQGCVLGSFLPGSHVGVEKCGGPKIDPNTL